MKRHAALVKLPRDHQHALAVVQGLVDHMLIRAAAKCFR
jgi:hypothetical protein